MKHTAFVVGLSCLAVFMPSPAPAATFLLCHGYECHYRTKLVLTKQDERHIRAILAQGQRLPHAEREALRKAVAFYEKRGTAAIGVLDKPRMQFGKARIKGQMDCIDESTNTDAFLRYLQSQGLLKFHNVERRTSRGLFLDSRYPHWTAVIRDNKGERWAVDSWFEPGGGLPDIMPLQEWSRRGVGGQR